MTRYAAESCVEGDEERFESPSAFTLRLESASGSRNSPMTSRAMSWSIASPAGIESTSSPTVSLKGVPVARRRGRDPVLLDLCDRLRVTSGVLPDQADSAASAELAEKRVPMRRAVSRFINLYEVCRKLPSPDKGVPSQACRPCPAPALERHLRRASLGGCSVTPRGYFAGAGGGQGKSLLKMSLVMSHFPSAPFLSVIRYFPVSFPVPIIEA
jgi:hypothetical protein